MAGKIGKRILLIGPQWNGNWTEPTGCALEELGYQVHRIYYNAAQVRNANSRRSIARVFNIPSISTPHWFRQLIWIWYGLQLGDRLLREASVFRPDLILTLKAEYLLPNTLHVLKQKTEAPVVTWWVDDPVFFQNKYRWLIFPRSVPLYDHVFIYDYSYLQTLRDLGATRVTFLPCAADPTVYHPEALSNTEAKNLTSRISFIGSFYPERGELIESLLDQPGLAVWGPGWEEFLKIKQPQIARKILRGLSLLPREINRIYQASDIVLNSHHAQTKIAGLNTRAFEILASGAFQLMDYVPKMESLLSPGQEVAVYSSPAEAATAVRKYLHDTSARHKIAQAGYERVLSEHTYFHRMQTLLSSL